MRVIYKYPFKVYQSHDYPIEVELQLPVGAHLMDLQAQRHPEAPTDIVLWASVDPAVEKTEVRRYRILFTGKPYDEAEMGVDAIGSASWFYIQTVNVDGVVCHVFEEVIPWAKRNV